MKFCSKLMVTSFLISILISANLAYASNDKIAVVDIQKVVSGSKQVKALKDEQYKKAAELEKWLEVAQSDISKQSTDENKKKLIKKYDEELAKKREINSKAYNKKLNEIDANVSQTIVNYAKSKGYDMVFAKSNVLYGGVDITGEIIKLIK